MERGGPEQSSLPPSAGPAYEGGFWQRGMLSGPVPLCDPGLFAHHQLSLQPLEIRAQSRHQMQGAHWVPSWWCTVNNTLMVAYCSSHLQDLLKANGRVFSFRSFWGISLKQTVVGKGTVMLLAWAKDIGVKQDPSTKKLHLILTMQRTSRWGDDGWELELDKETTTTIVIQSIKGNRRVLELPGTVGRLEKDEREPWPLLSDEAGQHSSKLAHRGSSQTKHWRAGDSGKSIGKKRLAHIRCFPPKKPFLTTRPCEMINCGAVTCVEVIRWFPATHARASTETCSGGWGGVTELTVDAVATFHSVC